MKKFLAGLMVAAMVFASPLFAAKVNLTKAGTNWVWQVDDDKWIYTVLIGLGWTSTSSAANVPANVEELTSKLLMEDGSIYLFENSDRIQLEG